MIEALRYQPDMAEAWNAFNVRARNGHFFFNRNFLEYHADRFQDLSYVLCEEGRILALLPANLDGDVAHTHQGLTFGGLIVDRLDAVRVIEAFEAIIGSLRAIGVKRLRYKAIPHIFQRQPAQEDLYALHACGARLWRRDLSSAIDLRAPFNYAKGKRLNIGRANAADLTFGQETRSGAVMSLVGEVLKRHSVRPVHTTDEIELLRTRFPQHIRVYGARRADRLLAGAILFLNPVTVHTQYLANSPEGREVGALDFLLDKILEKETSSAVWFSFGVSTTDDGKVLNHGLLQYKEAFGARGVVHDQYELDL